MIDNKIKPKIAFFGNSKFSVYCLQEMKDLGYAPDVIITTPDRPSGRRMELTMSETKSWAIENNIAYLEQEKLKDELFLTKIKDYDLFIVASYGKIVPKVILGMPKYGVLNIHPSLLPKYRGPSPLQTQIVNDDKDVGVTIMLMDAEIDHGPIIQQTRISIPNWPPKLDELKKITAKEGVEILIKKLNDWTLGKIKPVEQNHSEATFTKKVEKIDGELDIKNGDSYINYLKTQAYSTWPKTYFFAEKNGIKTRVVIKEAVYNNGVFEIIKVLPEGKKEMSYKDFLNGFKKP